MPYKNSENMSLFSVYFENTKLKPNKNYFYHTDLKNTLENIVFKEIPDNKKGLLSKVFSDKSKTLKATVKALLNEIKLRKGIDSHLLDRINENICRQHTLLEQLNNFKVHYIWDQFIDISKIKMQL